MKKRLVQKNFANLPTIHGYRWHLTVHSSTKKYKLYLFTQQSVKRNCESESDACRLCNPKFVTKNLQGEFVT